MRDVKIREKIHRGEWEVEIGCQTFRFEDPVELASDLLEYMTTEYPYDFEQAYLQENRHRTVGSYGYVEGTSETTDTAPGILEHLRRMYRKGTWDPFERRRAMEGNPNAHLCEKGPEDSVTEEDIKILKSLVDEVNEKAEELQEKEIIREFLRSFWDRESEQAPMVSDFYQRMHGYLDEEHFEEEEKGSETQGEPDFSQFPDRNLLYGMFEKIHEETGLSYESMYQFNRLLMPPIGQEGRERSTVIDRILADLISHALRERLR